MNKKAIDQLAPQHQRPGKHWISGEGCDLCQCLRCFTLKDMVLRGGLVFLFVFSNLALYQMGPATASPGEPLSRYTTFTDQLQESMPQFPQECLAGGATPVPDNQQEFFYFPGMPS